MPVDDWEVENWQIDFKNLYGNTRPRKVKHVDERRKKTWKPSTTRHQDLLES